MKLNKSKSRWNSSRKVMIFWSLFIGIGAVAGKIGMEIAPDGSALGMQALLPYFQVLPFAEVLFQNYIFPGIALLVVNGIPNLVAAYLLIKRKPSGIILGTVLGVTLMLWITIQFIIFPLNFMSTTYFIFGFLQFIAGLMTLIFYQQEHFHFEETEYQNIGKDPTKCVVYFSRMNYVKKIAYEKADSLGAEVYKIETQDKVNGTLGFWWCGRFGMHRWAMPIKPLDLNLENYEKVIICSPIWVFHLAAPMRTFCQAAKGRIKNLEIILVHFQRNKYQNAATEIETLLEVKSNHTETICSRLGKIIKRETI